MNLTDWMLEHLPAELVDENNYYGLAAHLNRLLAQAWEDGAQAGATGAFPDGVSLRWNPYAGEPDE